MLRAGRWWMLVMMLGGGLVWGQAASAPAWQWMGPATWQFAGAASPKLGGALAAVVPDPNVPGGAWAGGMGGVWSYSPGGWAATAMAQPVSALAEASDGSLIAGGANGVVRLAAGGTGWVAPTQSTPAGVGVYRLLADANGNVWAATGAGLFQSKDEGATWAATPITTGATWDVAESGTTVLGASATTLAALGLTATQTAVLCANPQGGFYVLTSGPAALWTLSVDGKTATQVALPALFQDSATALAVAADASGLWIGGVGAAGNPSVYTSSDGGKSWTAVALAAGMNGANVHAIRLNPAGTVGWIATDLGLYLTAGGQDVNSGLTNFAARGLVLTPTGLSAPMAPAMVAGGAAGSTAWVVSDSSSTWRALANCRAEGGSEWALDAAGGLWQWSAGSWVDSKPAAGYSVLGCTPDKAWALPAPYTAIAAISDGIAYAGSGGTLAYTADGGTTWATLATFPAPAGAAGAATGMDTITAVARDPVHTSVLAVALADAGIEVSLDGGKTWVAMGAGLPAVPVTALVFDSAENVWAATLGRGIYLASLAQAASSLTLGGVPTAAVAPGTAVTLTASYTVLGSPGANAAVTFSFSQGAQSVATENTVTDAAGVATVTYTTPTQAGPIAVEASLGGGNGNPPLTAGGTFTVAPAAAARLTVTAGNGQTQANGTVLLQPISFLVTDAYNNPIAGVAITLSAAAGTFNAGTVTTGANGTASVTYTLPPVAGAVTLTAIAAGLSASWTETALPTPDFSLTLTPPAAPPVANSQAAANFTINPLNGWTRPVTVTCTSPVPGCMVQGGAVLFPTGDGSQPVTVTISGAGGGLTRTASLDVAVEGIALSSSGMGSGTVSLSAGQAQRVPLTVTPMHGASGTVTLTLEQGSNLPSNLTLAFTPQATVALPGTGSGGAATAALTVAATANTSTAPGGAWPPWEPWLLLAGLGAAELLRRRGKRVLLLAGLGLALAGCGGSPAARVQATAPPATPAPTVVSYNVTVVATCVAPGGTMQATLPVTITVTQ